MQLTKPVDPFGEVNVYKKPDGSLDIVATILMVPDIEGARTGLALDASASMRKMYGVSNLVDWEPRRDEMVWAYEMKWK